MLYSVNKYVSGYKCQISLSSLSIINERNKCRGSGTTFNEGKQRPKGPIEAFAYAPLSGGAFGLNNYVNYVNVNYVNINLGQGHNTFSSSSSKSVIRSQECANVFIYKHVGTPE